MNILLNYVTKRYAELSVSVYRMLIQHSVLLENSKMGNYLELIRSINAHVVTFSSRLVVFMAVGRR